MEGNGPHRSQCPRFVLFPLDTNEERIPFSQFTIKNQLFQIGYERTSSAFIFRCGRCDVLPAKNDLFVESGKMVV